MVFSIFSFSQCRRHPHAGLSHRWSKAIRYTWKRISNWNWHQYANCTVYSRLTTTFVRQLNQLNTPHSAQPDRPSQLLSESCQGFDHLGCWWMFATTATRQLKQFVLFFKHLITNSGGLVESHGGRTLDDATCLWSRAGRKCGVTKPKIWKESKNKMRSWDMRLGVLKVSCCEKGLVYLCVLTVFRLSVFLQKSKAAT